MMPRNVTKGSLETDVGDGEETRRLVRAGASSQLLIMMVSSCLAAPSLLGKGHGPGALITAIKWPPIPAASALISRQRVPNGAGLRPDTVALGYRHTLRCSPGSLLHGVPQG
jgi:hypothetical protein